jgi:P-type E1-E2 ATPase
MWRSRRFGQPFAGLIIVLMQTGGETLEALAEGRASAAVRELEAAAPRIAHRLADGRTEDVAVEDVRVGDLLLVRPGELVPCDGVVVDGVSTLDVSRLTGEPLPRDAGAGTEVASGYGNGPGSLRMRATARARESQYARIVQLVRSAQAEKAPIQRLADRYRAPEPAHDAGGLPPQCHQTHEGTSANSATTTLGGTVGLRFEG